jgi:hypothetical protein
VLRTVAHGGEVEEGGTLRPLAFDLTKDDAPGSATVIVQCVVALGAIVGGDLDGYSILVCLLALAGAALAIFELQIRRRFLGRQRIEDEQDRCADRHASRQGVRHRREDGGPGDGDHARSAPRARDDRSPRAGPDPA